MSSQPKLIEGNSLSYDISFQHTNSTLGFDGSMLDGSKRHVPIFNELLSKHVMFLGGIGTGKTNAIMQLLGNVKSRMQNDDVMVVFDTKGDYLERFGKDDAIVISNDNQACGTYGTDYWNIYKEAMAGQSDEHIVEENVYEIATTIFNEKIERAPQPFFPGAARDVFAAVMITFIRDNNIHDLNNKALRQYFDSLTTEDLRARLSKHPDLGSIADYIPKEGAAQGQARGVVAELQQVVREVFIGNFAKSGNLSLREMIRQRKKKTVFIEYDLGYGSILTPIYRLMFDMAIKESLSRKHIGGNVYFFIDEFRLIPKLRHIDDGINFGRSLGVKFVLGVQNIGQLYHAYDEGMAKSILSGLSTQIAFRVQDSETRKYIQELFGRNRKVETFSSAIGTRGVVESARDGYTVEDWDILRLKTGQAIIGMVDCVPFVFQFNRIM